MSKAGVVLGACLFVGLVGCGDNSHSDTPDAMPDAAHPACSDGVDNDGDGDIDLADPGCASAADDDESDEPAACADGADNDGDGLIDLADPGCADATDDDETNAPLAACANGVDDDGDGFVDLEDPGCTDAADDDETDTVVHACSNGVDDDGDGLIDLLDPGCGGPADDDETDPVAACAGLPITDITAAPDVTDMMGGTPIPSALQSPTCHGFGPEIVYSYTVGGSDVALVISTDHPETTLDTVVYARTVCADPASEIACNDDAPPPATSASGSLVVVPLAAAGTTYYIVVDSFGPGSAGTFHLTVDEAAPLHGACDAADPTACPPGLVCRPAATGDPTTCEFPVCSDGNDNDDDGFIDYPFDPGCLTLDDGDETDPAIEPECGNGADDDADGLIDYPADPGCDAASDDLEVDECTPGKPVTILTPAGASGTTATSSNSTGGSCGGMDSPEFVYAFRTPLTLVSLTLSTAGSALDTVLYARADDCAAGTEIGCADDVSGFDVTSRLTFAPAPDTYYYVFVDSKWGASGTFSLSLSGLIALGNVCDPAIPQFACEVGATCRESVAGAGDFQCRTAACANGADDDADGFTDYPNDPGCDTPSDDAEDFPNPIRQCSNAADDDGDGFTDFPSDIGCAAASDDDELDECYPGQPVVALTPAGASGSTVGAPMNTGGTCGGTDAPEDVYTFATPLTLTSLTFSTVDPATMPDTVLYVRAADCASGAEVACNDDVAPGQQSTVTFTPTGGTRYYVFVDSKWGAAGAYTLHVSGIIAAGSACDPATPQLVCEAGNACRESVAGAGDFQCRTAACNDGVDNDGDGTIDYPFDPGCTSISDDDETFPNPITACSNTTDDDADGLTDYPADPGCVSAADDSEIDDCVPGQPVLDHPGGTVTGTTTGAPSLMSSPASCDPGLTTGMSPEQVWVYHVNRPLVSVSFSTAGSAYDTVLYVRYADCAVAGPDAYCNNDTAGMTSLVTIAAPATGYYFAVVDGEWSSSGPYDLTITGVVSDGGACDAADAAFPCAAGSTCAGGVCTPAACHNLADDDGDGLIDYPADPGCIGIGDDDETDPATPPQCADGLDNDGDGAIDWPADPSCSAASDDDEACMAIGTTPSGYTGCVDTPGVPPCDDITLTGTVVASSDDSSTPVALPFTFTYFGVPQTSVNMISNGKLGFPGTTNFTNLCAIENNTIDVYWDDLYPPSGGALRTQTFGTAPNRRVVFQWNIPHITDPFGAGNYYDIRAVLNEGTNDIQVCYVDTSTANGATDNGLSATVGIHGTLASDDITYSCNTATVTPGLVITYDAP